MVERPESSSGDPSQTATPVLSSQLGIHRPMKNDSEIEKLRYDNRELREAVDRLTGRLTSHANDLATIADIAEGSGTANSLPHIAKIARTALSHS